MRKWIYGLMFCLPLWAMGQEGDYGRCAPNGVAVGGYDLVSYHAAQGPHTGLAEFAEERGGLSYYFSSAENREAFLAAPERYLPVYSGWCAATLAMGRLVCPDFTNFKIEDGRLLLFELTGFTNGRTVWDSDPAGFRQRADRNYARLVVGQ